MTKEKRVRFWDIVKKVAMLVIVAGGATTTGVSALKFFARAKTVRAIDKRLELNISQDIVESKESDVRWMKQQMAFERRGDPKTIAETEIIKDAEAELDEVKARHNKRVEQYEEQTGEQF